jgi:hypothetical protein
LADIQHLHSPSKEAIRIMEWLRCRAQECASSGQDYEAITLEIVADCVECGEHLRASKFEGDLGRPRRDTTAVASIGRPNIGSVST